MREKNLNGFIGYKVEIVMILLVNFVVRFEDDF